MLLTATVVDGVGCAVVFVEHVVDGRLPFVDVVVFIERDCTFWCLLTDC